MGLIQVRRPLLHPDGLKGRSHHLGPQNCKTAIRAFAVRRIFNGYRKEKAKLEKECNKTCHEPWS